MTWQRRSRWNRRTNEISKGDWSFFHLLANNSIDASHSDARLHLAITILIIFITTIFLFLWHRVRSHRHYSRSSTIPATTQRTQLSSHRTSIYDDSSTATKPIVSLHINSMINKTHDSVLCQLIPSFNSHECKNGEIKKMPEALIELAKISELYLFSQVKNNEMESSIREFILSSPISPYIESHRLLFSDTASGRGSMVRQLQPTIHIESATSVLDALKGKVPNIVLLEPSESTSERQGRTLEECTSFVKAVYASNKKL